MLPASAASLSAAKHNIIIAETLQAHDDDGGDGGDDGDDGDGGDGGDGSAPAAKRLALREFAHGSAPGS